MRSINNNGIRSISYICIFGRSFIPLIAWVSLRSSCSLRWPGGVYVADPCELTYTNTLRLSNESLSLRCDFIFGKEDAVYSGGFSIISFIISYTFISFRVKEFHTLRFYIIDSILGRGYLVFPYGVTFVSCYRWGYPYMSNTTNRPIRDVGFLSYLFIYTVISN